MKGNEQIIERLNARLAEELTAINQYIVHSEMCANWGYERLHEAVEKRAIEEMKHAEKLIERILFFEGQPIVSNLREIHIGSDVAAQLRNDLAAEVDAVKAYNESIRLAAEVGDNGTRELLESILEDEEKHVDWLEAQLDQIEQMGIQNYLVEQIDWRERSSRTADGTIEICFDHVKKPMMIAVDKTFTWGQVGLASFDDNGNWDDFKLLRG